MTLNPTNPIVLQSTEPPKTIAADTGVVFVPADSGAGQTTLVSGQEVNALEVVDEGGTLTGEALSSAARQVFPLSTSNVTGAPHFVDSPVLGDQIGSVEAGESAGKGISPSIPDTAVPGAYDVPGDVVGTDVQNPVVEALSSLESTIPTTPATVANLTAGQNAPIAGTGGTPTNLGISFVVSEPGTKAAIL